MIVFVVIVLRIVFWTIALEKCSKTLRWTKTFGHIQMAEWIATFSSECYPRAANGEGRQKEPAEQKSASTQRQYHDEVFSTGRPVRECITSNPLHFAVGLWNNLPADFPTLDLAQFRREIRKFELYRMLQVRGWNPLNCQRIAQLSEDYWDF